MPSTKNRCSDTHGPSIKIKTNTHYFSHKLMQALSNIPAYPVTIVEAASGYGKTTCIRHFFRTIQAEAQWISFSENEAPEKSWERCCRAILRIDPLVGNRLLSLGLPSPHNTDEISQLFSEISCDEETYLIWDNFQLIQEYFSKGMWESFLFRSTHPLHIIALTQIINQSAAFLTHCAPCLYLSIDDLKFTPQDIELYFKKAGIKLTSQQLKFLVSYAEGWVAPLYLQLLYFSKHGTFQQDLTIHTMIEQVVLSAIEPEQRQTLISLSFFDVFTEEQASFITDVDSTDDFYKIPFLSLDKKKGIYRFHGILREVLQLEFAKLPKPMQTQIITRSAKWYVHTNNLANAILLYDSISEYDNILALIKDSSVFDELSLTQPQAEYAPLLERIAFTHIDEAISRFPLAYVLIGFEFFTQNKYEAYGILCEKLHHTLAQGILSEEEATLIEGELALIESFSVFNHISQMGAYHQKAFSLLQGKSSSIAPRDPWTFGNPSITSLYWGEAGKLEAHVTDMARYIPLYSAIVKGHGTGADTIFGAEVALLQGEDMTAENLCYKGLFQAKSAHQESLYLSAVFILLRVSIIRGNKEMYELCLEYLLESEKNRAIHYELSEIALIHCHIRLQFQVQSSNEPSARDLMASILPMGSTYTYCLLSRALLLKGAFVEFQILYEEAFALSHQLNSQLTKLYLTLYMAVAKMQKGDGDSAREHLIAALNMALTDGVLLPFAENYDLLQPLFQTWDDLVPASITDFCETYRKGLQVLRKNLYAEDIVKELTRMEYEVYRLASKNKKNKEIAQALYISENTVKTHLAHIYAKLGINSKKELS